MLLFSPFKNIDLIGEAQKDRNIASKEADPISTEWTVNKLYGTIIKSLKQKVEMLAKIMVPAN